VDALHLRTRQYTGGLLPTRPVGVTAGAKTSATVAGQSAILTATNLLARAHNHLIVAVPPVDLKVSTPFPHGTLPGACTSLALAVNPDITVEVNSTLPTGTVGIGVGAGAPPATLYVGGRRWTALLAPEPLEIDPAPSSILGVMMGVLLAAGAAFRLAAGLPARMDRAVSLWEMSSTAASTGPAEAGPVDVGSVWLVGAGAVGSSLAWWLHLVGVRGSWVVIDGDLPVVHNLNRSLGLVAADAGRPAGRLCPRPSRRHTSSLGRTPSWAGGTTGSLQIRLPRTSSCLWPTATASAQRWRPTGIQRPSTAPRRRTGRRNSTATSRRSTGASVAGCQKPPPPSPAPPPPSRPLSPVVTPPSHSSPVPPLFWSWLRCCSSNTGSSAVITTTIGASGSTTPRRRSRRTSTTAPLRAAPCSRPRSDESFT